MSLYEKPYKRHAFGGCGGVLYEKSNKESSHCGLEFMIVRKIVQTDGHIAGRELICTKNRITGMRSEVEALQRFPSIIVIPGH